MDKSVGPLQIVLVDVKAGTVEDLMRRFRRAHCWYSVFLLFTCIFCCWYIFAGGMWTSCGWNFVFYPNHMPWKSFVYHYFHHKNAHNVDWTFILFMCMHSVHFSLLLLCIRREEVHVFWFITNEIFPLTCMYTHVCFNMYSYQNKQTGPISQQTNVSGTLCYFNVFTSILLKLAYGNVVFFMYIVGPLGGWSLRCAAVHSSVRSSVRLLPAFLGN